MFLVSPSQDLTPLVAQRVLSPLTVADSDLALSAALWVSLANAAGRAAVAAASNATIAAAAKASFGLYGQTAEATGKMLLQVAQDIDPGKLRMVLLPFMRIPL